MIKLLVTGGNGQLGRAINELYGKREDIICVNTDVEDLDITDMEAVDTAIGELRPYAIINCAAYTAVEACETAEDLAFRINAIGPKNLSVAAEKYGAKMMHISTDYVFPGDADKPYRESDAVGPQGVYGASKLQGERFVQQFSNRYFILRTAWLYGDGKNFVKTMLQLAETHDELRVVCDQFGNPTSTAELAKAIDHLLFTENFGIFHATCEGLCSWADFAEEIFRLAGKDVKVIRVSTEEYNAKVKRPAFSALDNYMFRQTTGFEFADWKTAIREYMEWLNQHTK